MKGLVYISRTTQNLKHDDLNVLVDYCVRNNSLHNITGYLSFNRKGRIIQYIEGGDKEVQILFDKIYKDPKHKVTHYLAGDIKSRRFPDWGMHLLEEHDFKEIHDIMISHLFYLDSPKVLDYKNKLIWGSVDAISDKNVSMLI
jgi:FAD-dependent sensor of blue light